VLEVLKQLQPALRRIEVQDRELAHTTRAACQRVSRARLPLVAHFESRSREDRPLVETNGSWHAPC
jgi:hypothetical protein